MPKRAKKKGELNLDEDGNSVWNEKYLSLHQGIMVIPEDFDMDPLDAYDASDEQ